MRTRNEDDHDDLDVHDDHDRTSDDRSNDADEDDDSSRPSDLAPEVNLPGARELREAVVNVRRRAPKGEAIRRDVVAGLTVAVASVPDGMASGLLAGVSPVYGLYACMVGPIVGGILASTRLMVITTTSAASLTAGQALLRTSPAERESPVFPMVVGSGAFAIAFGLLRLGRMTRFVSYSVTTGFVAGIAVVLILSQLPTVVGYEVAGANRIAQTVDLLRQLDDIALVTLGLSALTAMLAILLQLTPARGFSNLIAITVPTAIVALWGLHDVRIVRDIAVISDPTPDFVLPAFRDALEVLTGALSVAVVALVQGAGVSQNVPNPDGSRSRASRDFIAQGAANIAAGLFRGVPVGGSLSTTALNVSSGARGRWAAILAGLWVGVIVIGFPALVGQVAMPALATILILAGARSIKPRDLASVWRAGWPSRLACAATFTGTLVLPIQAAIGLGVAISTLLYVRRASTDITLVELIERPDGRIEERRPPKRLSADRVTVLDVYGDLFYAGGRTLERLLPLPEEGAERTVVILRLRGRTALGATLEDVLSKYAKKLHASGGRLYLTGLSKKVHREVARMTKLRLIGPLRAYEVTPVHGESTHDALVDAEAWLVRQIGAE